MEEKYDDDFEGIMVISGICLILLVFLAIMSNYAKPNLPTEEWSEVLQRESHVVRIQHIDPNKSDFNPETLADICAALDDDAKENDHPEYIILSEEAVYKGEKCAAKAYEHFLRSPSYAKQCYERLITFY